MKNKAAKSGISPLLDCPHCGSPAQLAHKTIGATEWSAEIYEAVQCTMIVGCGALIIDYDNTPGTVARLTERWNRRVKP